MRANAIPPSLVLSVALGLTGCALDGEPELDTADEAITYGSLDGDAHPAVVLVIMDVDGQPAYRCSATLLSPTIVLTAGHCTGEPGEFSGMRVFTESDVQNGDNDYPFPGPNTVEAADWWTHPQYTSAAFYRHDVGVIELEEPVQLPAGSYGVLPAVDALDGMQPGRHTTFTAVGYGLQRVNPAMVEAARVRMNAEPHLVQIDTAFTGPGSLILSNNAATGGTCFGDSGGPNFVGDSLTVGGVTSFGLNGSCGGTGGVFRVDQADVLAFVQSHL